MINAIILMGKFHILGSKWRNSASFAWFWNYFNLFFLAIKSDGFMRTFYNNVTHFLLFETSLFVL